MQEATRENSERCRFFFEWLTDVNKALFRNSAESVFEYADVPWETWYLKDGLSVKEAVDRFRSEEVDKVEFTGGGR